MRIKSLEWRNFSSYGNKKQKLELNENSLYQIIGENGAGKTSISQAISFAIYGKVEGKKIGDIPNRINGNAEVKICIESNGNEILIERGIDPNFFRVYINGTEYDKANNRSVQEYLTDDLLGIPYHVFNNTISLSINDFKSFIKMSPQDKRVIIDKIFGFHILNEMRNLLKDELRKIKSSVDNTKGRIESLKESILISTNEMELLTNKLTESSKIQKDELEKDLKTFKDLAEIHKTKIEEFKIEEAENASLLENVNRGLIESRSRMREVNNKLDLYNMSKCPTCESDLSSSTYDNLRDGYSKEKNLLIKTIEDYEISYNAINGRKKELSVIKNDLIDKGGKIKSKIESIKNEIEKIDSSNNDSQVKSLSNIITGLDKDRINLESERVKSEEKETWIQLMDSVLGENGVKQMAIKTILPSLNSEIFHLMEKMNLEYQVKFDESFNASLYHMGADIPTQTLSTGEMKKVDFVVLIAVLKLMKMKFSSINLLFLDELFSSVDPDGVYSIVKILKNISKDMGLNVFVINHAPMPHEIFDWKMEVHKKNNFSSISIDKF